MPLLQLKYIFRFHNTNMGLKMGSEELILHSIWKRGITSLPRRQPEVSKPLVLMIAFPLQASYILKSYH